MYLAMLGNQLLSFIFADYISILSKLRRNTADIQGIRMDYHDKILFLFLEVTKIVYFIGNEHMLIAHDSNRLRFS